MAKRKRSFTRRYSPRRAYRRFRSKPTVPVAPLLGLVAGLAEPIQVGIAGNWGGAVQLATINYTGYDIATKKFYWQGLMNGMAPLIGGILVHKFVGGNLGVNRMLSKAKVPYIRL